MKTKIPPPISDAKLAANRANALHSTGPTSEAGKRIVSRNATLHNLCSISPAIAGEDKLEFDHFLWECKIDLAPRTHTELALVEQIALAEWKLLRCTRWETRIIDTTFAGKEATSMYLFGKTPDEALARLHRYESGIRRAWHNALRELRQVKKSNREAATLEERASFLDNLEETKENTVELDDSRTNPNPPIDASTLTADPPPPVPPTC